MKSGFKIAAAIWLRDTGKSYEKLFVPHRRSALFHDGTAKVWKIKVTAKEKTNANYTPIHCIPAKTKNKYINTIKTSSKPTNPPVPFRNSLFIVFCTAAEQKLTSSS